MVNQGAADFNQNGENKVELWLLNNGYSKVEKQIINHTEIFIIASGKVENIMIKVKTFLPPRRPVRLNGFEIDKLTRNADKQGLVAYVAYVVLDYKNELAEEIIWERLG